MSTPEDIRLQEEYNRKLREQLDLEEKIRQERNQDYEGLKDINNVLIGNLKELTKQNSARKGAISASRELKSISDKLLDDALDLTDLDKEAIEKLQSKNKIAMERLNIATKDRDLSEEDKQNAADNLIQADELNKALEKRLGYEKNITKAMGLQGNLASGINEGLKKSGFGKLADSLGIDDAIKSNRKFTKSLLDGGKKAATIGDKFKIAKNFVGSLGKNLLKALGPVVLIAELVQGIFRADQETTELGKSMALTKGEATLFRENLAEAARDSGNIAVTSEKVVKSFNELNKQLGFINNFTLDTLVTMTKLTEQVGLSAQEAGGLVTLSEARGKNAEDEYKAVLATTYNLQRQTGIQLDNREVLKAVAAVSGQLRANLEANPAAIAEAVTLAVQLGGSLDDVKNISSAILDFEASIAKELEAELLTGKEINLERARLAALNGDIADLTREISSQVGTFTEFSKMNVIQQEALAQAFGLSSDRLSDMLFKQQVMGKSAKELRALGEDELADRVEQLSLADKFNQTVDKLKSIFADVGQAFDPVLQLLGFALSIVGLIAGIITDIISMLKGDFDFSSTAASWNSLGSQLGFEGGGGGSGYNSDGRRPASSRNGSMTSNNQPVNVNVTPNIYMDERKLSTGMSMNNYAVGS